MADIEKSEPYARLVTDFAKSIKGMPIEGIPAPHIPVVGRNYDKCAYKMAFVGMETKETKKSRNCKAFIEDPETAMRNYEKWLDESEMFKNRERSVYWLFIKHFLQKFYHVKNLKIKKGKYHALMSSFVWGNANAIERYDVTAEKMMVDYEVWKKVKKASKPFDSINHLIDATHPKVIFITYKAVDKEYILQDNDVYSKNHEYVIDGKKIRFRYYYLSNRDTHIFVTPHPTWMNRCKIGFKPYIKALIQAITEYAIWSQLPQSEDDWATIEPVNV